MKKLILSFASLTSLLFINCSSDDSNSSSPSDGSMLLDVAQNPIEESPINLQTLEKGITIPDAIVKTGTITPTGDISFDIDAKKQSAFLDTGFSVELEVPDNYAGAFIQLKGDNGELSDTYFDISNNQSFGFKNLNKQLSTSLFTSKNTAAKSLEDDTNVIEIDVEFENTIPPGRFCYLVCIYDDQGNISEPTEVCVEVEAWGGNSNLVGTWTYDREEIVLTDGTKTIRIGEKSDCFTNRTFCDNTQKEVEHCEVTNSLVFTLSANGTQTIEENTDEDQFIFDEEDINNCAETAAINILSTHKGNWAYNEEEKKLTLVIFEFSGSEDGEPITDEFEIADNIGIGFDVEVFKLTSNELVFKVEDIETIDNNGDVIDTTGFFYFKK